MSVGAHSVRCSYLRALCKLSQPLIVIAVVIPADADVVPHFLKSAAAATKRSIAEFMQSLGHRHSVEHIYLNLLLIN